MTPRPVTDAAVANHLARARLHALSDAPYLASALTAMTFVETPGIGTVGIDDRLRTYVDPEAVSRWTVAQLAGALIHEANHFLRDHHGRAPRGPRAAHRWNIAGDLEINDDISAAGIELPPGALQPASHGLPAGRTAEWYFAGLPESVDDEVILCCGSGATGSAMPWELGEGEPGISRSRAASIVESVAEAIRNSPPGTVPGGLSRWAEASRSEVHWTAVLRASLRAAVARAAGQTDYSWSSPNRRHRGRVLLPRLRGPRIDVLCIIDTSGSMTQGDIDAALGEVDAICRSQLVERAHVASCDATATLHGEFRSLTAVELVGGGGTTLEIALTLIDENHLAPNVVVFLTDGLTVWSDDPPHHVRNSHTIVVTPNCGVVVPNWAFHVTTPTIG